MSGDMGQGDAQSHPLPGQWEQEHVEMNMEPKMSTHLPCMLKLDPLPEDRLVE
jgi:hypothetical protein